MYHLAAVIFSVCVLNSQATSTTPSSTSATTSTASATTSQAGTTGTDTSFVIKYKFNLYTNTNQVNAQQIENAAKVAVVGLGIDGGQLQTVAPPTKSTQKVDGVGKPVFIVLLAIKYPNKAIIQAVTTALSGQNFATQLQYQLKQKGITTALITEAETQQPGQSFVPAAIPTTVAPVTTTTTAQECGKSPVVGGLLTLFLGGFGAGRFYYGYIGMGVGWLFWTLFAHISTPVGQVLLRSGGAVAGAVLIGLGTLSELGIFIWWIHDLVVMFNKTLKPSGMDNCEFSD